LGFIFERPMHGYELYQQLTAPDGLWQVWRIKQSQLYALLSKLEDAQYLDFTLHVQDARPPRKIYSLTEAGRAAFHNWLTTPVARGRQMRIEFLAKLYFAHRQDPSLVLQLLERQIAVCQQWLLEIQGSSAAIRDSDYFVYAVHQFRLSQIDSFLTWLTACRQALDVA
jgi:PadR family transcriptional regulator AphA